jgi:cell division protein FtsA
VLTGGCANLPGRVELAAGYGRTHARLGDPAAALGLPAELRDSAFATAVGLLVWGVQHRHAGAYMAEQPVRISLASRLRGWLGRWGNPLHQPGQRPTGARV